MGFVESLTSQTTTVAPALIMASAIALPIPEPPPVTSARKPVNPKLAVFITAFVDASVDAFIVTNLVPEIPTDHRHIGIQSLDLVEITCLLSKNMHDDIAIVN